MRIGLLLLILCAPIAAQEARIVERLADGTKVVLIDGVEHRALPPPKVAELAKQRIDLEAAQKINAELRTQVTEALLQRDLAKVREDLQSQKVASLEADFNRAKEDSARWHGLFISERDLRREASQFVPHGNKTKFDKFLALFDSKVAQFTIKGLIPIWTAGRCQ